MSSSPSRAFGPGEGAAAKPPAPKVTPFPYGEAPLGAGRQRFPRASPPVAGRAMEDSTGQGQRLSPPPPEFLREAQLGEAQAGEAQAREVQIREAGRQQGVVEARAQFEEQAVTERAAVAAALTDFARARSAYYRRLEEETVQLALAIARKVIHREAQVDPLLLLGIVRVAFERMEGATGVTLAVPPEQAAGWRRYLSAHLAPGAFPEIVEDAALEPQRCVLKTSMGTAQLGLEVQLKEIEQGLTDLLAARPAEKETP